MRCHTWPPAASAPHMGVRATMSGPPSPAPGWHILIHERAWALSGQNYPYQNATINTFINPTSESTFSSSFFPQKHNPSPKSTILTHHTISVCWASTSGSLKANAHTHTDSYTFFHTHAYHVWQQTVTDHLSHGFASPSLGDVMALWMVNSVSPRCWWADPLTYWHKTPWTGQRCLKSRPESERSAPTAGLSDNMETEQQRRDMIMLDKDQQKQEVNIFS